MKIKIDISTPEPNSNKYKKFSICEKACDFIKLIEDGEASDYHFNYLKNLYKKLNKKQNLPRHLAELMSKLTEFLSLHEGYQSGEDQLDLEGVDIFKYD